MLHQADLGNGPNYARAVQRAEAARGAGEGGCGPNSANQRNRKTRERRGKREKAFQKEKEADEADQEKKKVGLYFVADGPQEKGDKMSDSGSSKVRLAPHEGGKMQGHMQAT